MSTSTTATLGEWLQTINRELGTSFREDEPGRMTLEFEGGLRVGVEFEAGNSAYVIYAPIGALSSAAELPRLLVALQLNLYQRATAGGVIGLDAANGMFVYSFSSLIAHSSPEIFAHQIDQFAEHARRLQQDLEAVPNAHGEFDFELETMQDDLGLLSEAEAESAEAGDLDEPRTGGAEMVRV